jgi:hypothetical protein
MSSVQAAVVHITVDEPSDDPPAVTTDIVSPTTSSAFETATVSGFVLGSSLPVGTTSVLLVEPTADPFNQPNSDLIILQILQATTDGSTSQQVNLAFFSDSFQGFDRLVAANPNAVSVTENGSLEDITAALGLPVNTDGSATILQVRASSDLNTPETPEPGSLALFGIGVAGILGYKSRKRKSTA